ncbi:MAG: hypothetical protein ACKO2G_13505 [Verrucomicrobiales bacterium]
METHRILQAVVACLVLSSIPAIAAEPGVSMSVKAVSGGTNRKGKTAVDSRLLRIELENRSDKELAGLKVEWQIYGKDIQNHNKMVDEKGSRTVKLPAKGRMTVQSDPAKFAETEGGSKTVGKGKNKRTVGTPDTGRAYAGYVVTVKLNGKVIAEEATAGLGKGSR